MFKNYLTYSFIVSFHQLCRALELRASAPQMHRILRSAEQVMVGFEKYLRAPNDLQRGVCLYSAFLNLRECQEELEKMAAWNGDLQIKGTIILARLEQLTLDSAKSEGGQLRMLG